MTEVALALQLAIPKRIVVIYWGDKDFPANVLWDQSFQAAFRSSPQWTEYYPEYLDNDRFPGEAQSQLAHDYLRQKYADRHIDAVVAIADAPLNFLLKYRDDLFSTAPIIFTASKLPPAEQLAAGPGLTGFINRNSYKETLDLALRMHPGTEQVFIVSGSLMLDKVFENACRRELQGYENRLKLIYLTDLSPIELTAKIKSLPGRSIIYYIWQRARNEQGRILESQDYLSLVADAASTPIYGVASWQIGRGIVGGYIRNTETLGEQSAKIALRIANGARAQDIPVEDVPIEPMFDLRQLQRWGISENALPTGSIIRFRTPTLWDQWKWYLVGLSSVVVMQSMLIAGLVINRIWRKRAEQERLRAEAEAAESHARLTESEQRFRNMADTAPVKIWIAGVDGRCSYFNRRWLEFRGRTIEEERGDGWTEGVHPDDLERCRRTYESALEQRQPFTMEYRLRRSDGQFRWIYSSGTARFSLGGEFAGYIGSCIDITERKEAEQTLHRNELALRESYNRIQDLAGRLIVAREEELKHIARALHDDLNQEVAVLAIGLDTLCQQLPESEGTFRQQLLILQEETGKLSGWIRKLSHNLHSSVLDHMGLAEALKSHCSTLKEQHGIAVTLNVNGGTENLPSDVALCLYRVAQEALRNVVKHSGAKSAELTLAMNGVGIELRVADRGTGFEASAAGRTAGLGLLSIEERVRVLGGKLEIKSNLGAGTELRLRVPAKGGSWAAY